jgi:hypothetical protein
MNALVGPPDIAPSPLARDVCGFAAALLLFVSASGGLFFLGALPQLAFVCGVLAALFATRVDFAAAEAAFAIVAGWLIAPPFDGVKVLHRGDAVLMLACAIGAGAVAAGVRWVAPRGGRHFIRIASGVLVALVVANFAVTALAYDVNVFSVTGWLAERPKAGTSWSDAAAYAEMHNRMLEGQTYYQAVAGVHRDNAAFVKAPEKVLDVRPPALQMTLAAIARTPASLYFDLLALSALGIVASSVLASTLVRRQFAVVAAAPVAMSLLGAVPTVAVIFAETWAVSLALIALAALVHAAAHEKWRAAFVTGVVAAVLAASVREFCLILPVAGLAATFVAPLDRRRFQRIAWGAAAVLLVAYYGAHFAAASRILAPGTAGGNWWFSPSVNNLVLAVQFFSGVFRTAGWLPFLLVLAGIAGIAGAPRGQSRVVLAVTTGALVVAFAIFRNSLHNVETGQAQDINYWGILLVPILLACAPGVFAFVTGMRRYRADAPPPQAARARRG